MALFGFGKKTAEKVFLDYYNQALTVIRQSKWNDFFAWKSDLVPLMRAIAEYVANNSGKDLKDSSEYFYNQWYKNVSTYGDAEYLKKKYAERVNFYNSFFKGKTATMDFWQGREEKPMLNPALNATAAFCDILYNPNRLDNYDEYTFLIVPMTVTMNLLQQIYSPMNKVIANYYNSLCDSMR